MKVDKLLFVSGVVFLSAAASDIHFVKLAILNIVPGVLENGLTKFVVNFFFLVEIAFLIWVGLV
jgi:hypothetical protein